MALKTITVGRDVPQDINVIIEIPAHGQPVKYEVDKKSGTLCVDRFISTAMFYPANYGYIPQTLSEDGDPVDILVITPYPLLSGSMIRCRVIGMLNMTDEAGADAKLLAVPINKLTQEYTEISSYQDLNKNLRKSIEHFFEHYKDLESGKWVKIAGWADAEAARQEIEASIKRYRSQVNLHCFD